MWLRILKKIVFENYCLIDHSLLYTVEVLRSSFLFTQTRNSMQKPKTFINMLKLKFDFTWTFSTYKNIHISKNLRLHCISVSKNNSQIDVVCVIIVYYILLSAHYIGLPKGPNCMHEIELSLRIYRAFGMARAS